MQCENRASTWVGVHGELAAQTLCTLGDTKQAMPMSAVSVTSHVTGVKPFAVVSQRQPKLVSVGRELDGDTPAFRVTDDVVDAFFEHQENLSASVRANLLVLMCIGSVKIELDTAGIQNVTSKPPHAMIQISQAVPPRINRPHNIAHRIH